MTKDQLIRKVLDSAVSGSKKEAEDAIDEYAKQESIAFERFLVKGYTYEKANGFWYNIEINHEGANAYDREELFKIFKYKP